MLKMAMLTEEQEEAYINKRHEYTDMEIRDLAVCAGAIKDLSYMCSMFHLRSDGWQEDINAYGSMFTILEWLAEPINRFLSEGAPKAETGPEEEPAA